MRVKATVSFTGAVTMFAGEVREITDGSVLTDLIRCGYVTPLEEKSPKPNQPKPKSRRQRV